MTGLRVDPFDARHVTGELTLTSVLSCALPDRWSGAGVMCCAFCRGTLGLDASGGRTGAVDASALREAAIAAAAWLSLGSGTPTIGISNPYLPIFDVELQQLVGFLRSASAGLTYGYIRRTRHYAHFMGLDDEPDDSRGHSYDEATLMPDAHGIQLLGPGYRDRAHESEHFAAEPIGNGCTLLAARDLGDWFGDDGASGRSSATDPRRVLEEARIELAPLLRSEPGP